MFGTGFVSMYPWETDELGETHGGQPGVVVEDGTEPGPIRIPSNSGSNIGKVTEWWGFDGSIGPTATHLRGSCSCGWRGATLYPVDWDEAHKNRPYEYDTSGPEADWKQHVIDVESQLVPLPDDVVELLNQLRHRLGQLSDREPLMALRAANIVQRDTQMSADCAARKVQRNETSAVAVGIALGCSAKEAKDRLRRYTSGF